MAEGHLKCDPSEQGSQLDQDDHTLTGVAFMRKDGPIWEIGPRSWQRLLHRGFLVLTLVSLITAVYHWLSWRPFHNGDLVLIGIVVAVLGLVAAGTAHFLYTMTPKVRIDVDAREFVVDGHPFPFALAGPIAMWKAKVRVSGGVHGSDSVMETWMAAIICGGPATSETLIMERDARREADPDDETDISVDLEDYYTLRITAGTRDEDGLRLAAGDLVRLWNNQVINVRGGGNDPDLSQSRLTLHPTRADIDALDDVRGLGVTTSGQHASKDGSG